VATRTKDPTDITVGSFPRDVAITPDGKTAFVSNRNSDDAPGPTPGTVSVIDVATRTKDPADISGFVMPTGMAITPDGKDVYVTNEGADLVSTIDVATKSKVAPYIDVGTHPTSLEITSDGKVAYVANMDSVSVSTIDVVARTSDPSDIPLAGNPGTVAITPCQVAPPTTTTTAPSPITVPVTTPVVSPTAARPVSVQPTFVG
jgi:YVTN family beta-propeller protein